MFFHNLKYSIKTLFRNKMMIFWTFAFPIILGTFFNMAFSNIENSEKLSVIDIAIVEKSTGEETEIYEKAFASLSDSRDEDRLFDITYTSEEEAKKLLEEEKITGYLRLSASPEIVITSNGIDETIFKYAIEQIKQSIDIIKDVLSTRDYATSDGTIMDTQLEHIQKNILRARSNIIDESNTHMSYTMIEYYTLIAMTCLYGGLLGLSAIDKSLANISNKGKRVAASPTSKATIILSSSLAAYLVELVGLALLFIYTIFVIGVDYGTHLPQVILLALTGSFAGLSLGVAIGCLFKANEDTKTGILISITMLGCFFSGMMGITMKYIIDAHVPFINAVNPANMITDGFYALYYYGTSTRFYGDLRNLLLFSALMVSISIFCLRRQRYDSI